MIIQGSRCNVWRRGYFFLSVGLAIASVLGIVGCSTAIHAPASAPADLSGTPPLDLLTVFLERERSRGAVKFTFNGEIEVKAGDVHSFRGVGAYKNCDALRIQLLGPLGFTLLEYINSEGEARLVANQLTPQGDEEAKEGLLQMMEIFTLALIDRCYPSEEFEEGSHNANLAKFITPTQTNGMLHISLDRHKAVLMQQSITGGELPDTVINYMNHRSSNGYWMPDRIEIKGKDMPVSIDMEIRKWSVDVDLPDHLFTVD
ncbi:MAG: hypothetical protein QNK29_06330 [Desulfobacterales bacterium]|nr:hypothetical protein [Desulfobacterales bacterium]